MAPPPFSSSGTTNLYGLFPLSLAKMKKNKKNLQSSSSNSKLWLPCKRNKCRCHNCECIANSTWNGGWKKRKKRLSCLWIWCLLISVATQHALSSATKPNVFMKGSLVGSATQSKERESALLDVPPVLLIFFSPSFPLFYFFCKASTYGQAGGASPDAPPPSVWPRCCSAC